MKTSFLTCCLLLFYFLVPAQNQLQLVSYSSGFTDPVDMANCGDSRLFVVQKAGQIIIINPAGKKLAKAFLNINDRVTNNGGEEGLLGMAFDPGYKTNGYFYVNYINNSGNTQISRFKVTGSNANQADPESEKFILQVAQPYTNHKGGCLKFGPDGYLYIGLGDGGSAGDPENRAQNHSLLLGKMLRINVHSGNPYSIPSDNPFVNVTGYSPEIWDLGVRNPWRFSFDSKNGALIIADVGQDLWEEIDREKPGSKGGYNYGWRCYEGNHEYNTSGCSSKVNYTFPVYEYQHINGNCSIIGGYVYRGRLNPKLYGKYIYTDYCSGQFHALTFGNPANDSLLFTGGQYVYNSFGEDVNGELYVCSDDGTIYKLSYADNLQAVSSSINKTLMYIYPNPSKGRFLIEYKAASTATYNVYITNQTGVQIYNSDRYLQSGINKLDVNLSSVVKGIYRITLSDKSGIISAQQLIIE